MVSMNVVVRLMWIVGLIGIVLFLLTEESKAADYATGMLGVFNSAKHSGSEVKLLNMGHREELGFGLLYQYEAGGWLDRGGDGRKSSGYAAYQIGAEAGNNTIARVMAGPALITTTDTMLGGHFQFTEDFFIGLKGDNGNIIGILYKHFSSAGLESPNVGRDLMGVQVSIPL